MTMCIKAQVFLCLLVLSGQSFAQALGANLSVSPGTTTILASELTSEDICFFDDHNNVTISNINGNPIVDFDLTITTATGTFAYMPCPGANFDYGVAHVTTSGTPTPEPTPTATPTNTPTPTATPVPTSTPEPTQNIIAHSLAHSLWSWDTPESAQNDETTVPKWVGAMANSTTDKSFGASGQHGALPSTPFFPQLGWEDNVNFWMEGQNFQDANINTIIMTVWAFEVGTPTDDEVAAIVGAVNHAESIRDPGVPITYYLYESWPDAAVYTGQENYPLNQSEFDDFNTFTLNQNVVWYDTLYSDVLVETSVNFVHIPVARILSEIYSGQMPNIASGAMTWAELFEDNDPHGRETVYFLASLVVYMALYNDLPPPDFVIPNSVHQAVRDNYGNLAFYIWNRLNL